MPSTLSLSPFVAMLLSTVLPTMVSAGGVQTDKGPGAFYPGGMIYDDDLDMLYLAGLHYNIDLVDGMQMTGSSLDSESNCFLASVDLSPDGNVDRPFDSFTNWISWGEPDVLETCSSITLHPHSNQLVVVGSTAPNGFIPNTPSDVPLSGMIAVAERDSLMFLQGLPLVSNSAPELKMLYPMSVVSDNKDTVYIAALTTTDNVPQTDLGEDPEHPNWFEYMKYGSHVFMSVLRVSVTEGQLKGVKDGEVDIEEIWTREFPTTLVPEGVDPNVSVGGLILKKDSEGRDLLVISGSTRAFGEAYGSAEGTDEDGFLTILDPATGNLYEGIPNNMREGTEEDDLVLGICDDPSDPNSFYVLGATRGALGDQQADPSVLAESSTKSLQPFLRKVDLSYLNQDWSIQWAALPAEGKSPSTATVGYAAACHVHGENVFVTGAIESGARMVQHNIVHPSQGGDDVWVARVKKADGEVEWLNQLGSDGDEDIAWYGGLEVDIRGDPVIFGDTTGSMFRRREDGNDSKMDMFVMSLDGRTGAIMGQQEFLGGSSMTAEIQGPETDPIPGQPEDVDDNENPDDVVGGDEEMIDGQDGDDIEEIEENDPRPLEDRPNMPLGLQFKGPAYAGGIAYDQSKHSVLLVGSIFAKFDGSPSPNSQCFTAIVNLDTNLIDNQASYGSGNWHEACSAISYDIENDIAYAVGAAQSGNDHFQAESDWEAAVPDSVQAGMVMQIHNDLRLMGGNRMGDSPVVYPIGVEAFGDSIYVLSMGSEDPGENKVQGREYPNFTLGGPYRYGSDFFLRINKYAVNEYPQQFTELLPATLEEEWEAKFSTDSGSVYVGGMELIGRDALIVVGSTQGSGGPFENDGSDDMDGFILKIDPQTGQLSTSGSDSTTRIDSVNKKDDWVYGVCADHHERNHDHFFIVGSTDGKIKNLPDNEQPPEGSTHAFVARIRSDDLSPEWIKHFTTSSPAGGSMVAEAMACAVSANREGNEIVFVGGTVYDGALMDGADIKESHGQDDIFVASIFAEEGTLHWMVQIGSQHHDNLAPGKGLEIDSFGNVIVFGETQGVMYADHDLPEGEKDLILLTIQQDGTYMEPRVHTGGSVSPPAPYYGPTTSNKSSASDSLVAVYGIIAAVIVIATIGCFFYISYQKKKQAVTNKAKIFRYLQKFDVEDVDLRKSPPGGWHGTYLNKLAYGINKAAESNLEMESGGDEAAPLTHSSVVTDSLFMDTASKPSLSYGDEDLMDNSHEARPGREVI
jgi:hypothetical protein